MRTSTLLVLSLSTAATLVTAEKEGGGGGGALQALLERMQTKKQQNQARALGAGHAAVRPPPEDYSNGTDSHNSTSSAPHSNKSHPKSAKDSSSSSAKSDSASTKHGKKVHHDRPAPSAVESSAKSRLRSSDSARRPLASDKKSKTQASSTSALEKELHIVESGGRLPQGVRTHGENAEIKTASAGKAAAATDKLEKRVPEKTVKTFGKKEELKKPEDKRWVWGTAIIQDDTPAASNVPAVGENANYLNSAAANTPTATLAAPSFPPLAAELPSSQSAAALQSKVASRQKMSDRKKAAQAPAAPAKEKRWTWGNEIIQDGDENAPPVGENANLLSKGTTIAMNTPVAQLTPPSFPPLADATTSAEPATETFEALESNEGEGAEAAAQVVEQASSTLSAVAAEMTSGTPDIEALLNKLQEEINALANAYSQVTQGGDVVDAAAETSPAENAKRWVWGPSIIQDDTPASAAPPIGQNANLLNPAIPVETPSNKPLAPSFPARVGLATAPVSLASINNLAAAPASPAPVTPPVSVPAEIDTAADSTSTTTSRMNRKSQADSIRSARAAALKTRSAAMEWHLVNKKRQVGGMAKQHKRV